LSENVAPDQNDPQIIYGGRVDRLDTRTGVAQSIDPTLATPDIYRRTWTLPLVFSRRDPKVLYFANQRLFRTADGGKNWTVISPDLTREKPGVPPNLDAVTAAVRPTNKDRLGVIYAIAPSRLADGDLWVGTDDGQVWRSKDEGAHWSNITPSALTPWSKVGIIETSRFDAESAYIAIDRHRLDDFRPYIYRTRDGGTTWQLIANGIPAGSFVNAVREDPVRKGLLYAATEKGMYVSFDDGNNWQSLQLNLPVTSVRDIDINGKDVVIGTHGRAFWILDDVTPIRQMETSVASAKVWLFKPAVTVRERQAGFTGTPLPKDEPMAANPPAGAYIDYVLHEASSEPVTIEILDAAGATVRRYSSSDVVTKADPAKLRTAAEWHTTPSTVQTGAGMHRFVWPLRYSAPAALSTTSGTWTDGVWAPPGNYTVVLTANGQRLTQPLTIVPDPRVKLPAMAYAEQFALAREVETLRARTTAAAEEAAAMITTIDDRRTKTNGEALQELNRFREQLQQIADVNVSGDWWLFANDIKALRYLASTLDELGNAVDGADAAPSPDNRTSLARLRPLAESALAAWDRLKREELPRLNEALKGAKLEPIAQP
jgi:photosystem II stability/assembly factor-like uncharacterized protein